MGHKDLTRLYEIVTHCRYLTKKNGWPYQWKWDQGDYETAIEFHDDNTYVSPPRHGRSPYNRSGEIYCPDILDYHNKIIIENEEEAKPNTGYLHARRRKGHFPGNKHDTERDKAYLNAKFRLLLIYESDKEWKMHLEIFLKDCLPETAMLI